MGRRPGVRATGRGPAEVDDPAGTAIPRGSGDVAGGRPVDVLEVRPAQRMHEVVDDVGAVKGVHQAAPVGDIALDDLDLPGPGHVPQPVRRADQAAHLMPLGQQQRHQPPADIPARAGHQAPDRAHRCLGARWMPGVGIRSAAVTGSSVSR
jgi:hypothetical protein